MSRRGGDRDQFVVQFIDDDDYNFQRLFINKICPIGEEEEEEDNPSQLPIQIHLMMVVTIISLPPFFFS